MITHATIAVMSVKSLRRVNVQEVVHSTLVVNTTLKRMLCLPISRARDLDNVMTPALQAP